MITDYNTYEPARRERLLLEGIGYGCIAAIVYLFYRSLLIAGLCGLLARRCLPFYQKHMVQKRQLQLHRQFGDLLISLSASIAAGRQMEEALSEACDNLSLLYEPDALIMRELHFMKRSIRENRETDRSLLSDFAVRSGSEDIRSFVQVYLTCRGSGGDLQQIIAHSAELLAEKMKISEQIRVITAQKKLEGRMICLMPAAMLLALNLLSPSYISVLYSGLAGRLIMTLCLGGALAGLVLMEKITDVAV
ncbi:MAG: type II secretion system F family protein [Firmicutes bacterium]|nr:type II secretion system F family protein [Bacillota bacterium]